MAIVFNNDLYVLLIFLKSINRKVTKVSALSLQKAEQYSGNFATDWNGVKILPNPPGSHYGMVMQKIEFLSNSTK